MSAVMKEHGGEPAWLVTLRREVKATSQEEVAQQLDYKRTAVSLVLAGKYPARTDKIAARVMLVFGRVACPFLEREISGADCHTFHTADTPTSSPLAMRHWRACQGCPNNRSKKP